MKSRVFIAPRLTLFLLVFLSYSGIKQANNFSDNDGSKNTANTNRNISLLEPSIDGTTIKVDSIIRNESSPINAASVSWNITFASPITGLTSSNFTLANSGLTDPSITDVSGSGAEWTVTANTGAGSGTLGLNLTNDIGLNYNLSNIPFTGEVFEIDKTNPTLSSSTPTDNSTNATLGGNIVLTFDDNMAAGTGNVTIRRSSDNSIFEQIPVTDARVTINANQVTINPTGNFMKGTAYYLEIDATAFDDDAGNSFVGISENATLNFITVDVIINEVVTEPQRDWSTNNFNGVVGGGAITDYDEWLELLINSSSVNLTGWIIELMDGSNIIGSLAASGAFVYSNYIGSGSFTNTDAGDYLVLGRVNGGAMNNSITINLKDPAGVIVDAATFQGTQSSVSNSNDMYDESAQRFPNGTDTDADENWTQGQASMGGANTGPSVTLLVSSSSVAENAGTSTITATLSAASSQTTTVNLSIGGTAASGTDYSLSSTTITIPSGSVTGTATITAIQDTKYEENETIIIDITSVTNGTEAGTQQQTVTITEDDSQPSVALSLTGNPFAENGGVAIVTATLSNLSYQNVTVNLGFSGTATLTSDYTRSNTSITINAGSSTGSITLTGVDDVASEGDETVIVEITSVTNGTETGTQIITATITDDEKEINVLGNGNTIVDGDVTPSTTDDTDFGNTTIGGTISKTFTIQNTGAVTLTLGANAVLVFGGQSGDFTITTQPATTIAAGSTDIFTIQFAPTAGGTRSTTVNITSDDADENPYNFTIQGVGIPTVSSATYNYSTNVLTVTGTGFVANAAGADVDVSMLTFTGEGGSTFTLNSSSDVEINSATEFSVTLSGADIPNVEALLNKDGTSSAGGTTYNLACADDWLTGFDSSVDIADLTDNGITVSNYANPQITSATYDASTGILVVTGTNFVSNSGTANDIDASLFTITGGISGSSYTLTNTADVELTSAIQFTLTLSATDQLNVNGLLNKNGIQSGGATTYNIAGADNWAAGAPSVNNIEDLSGNAITVSNVQTPTITSATYDSDTGIFVVTGTNLFKNQGTVNDIDVSKFTVEGEGGTYTITSTVDVEITSSTEFTFTVTGADRTQVDAKLDLFGTQSSGGTTYNLAAADDWLAGADPDVNIADLVNNGITVMVNPKITNATYNAATGVIVVTGTNIQANGGGADIDASKFSITGEGGETYTLTNTPSVERTSPTQFTLTLHVTDWNAIAQIINKNGTTSTSGTTYNIAAADDWCTNVTSGNTADLTGNGITAGNVAVPTITSSTYNVSTGVLTVTGSRLVKKSGVLNDIDISKFTITGEGGDTYNLANTADVEITSGTQFTVTLDAADKNAVNIILNKNGVSSTSATTYNLAAAEDWAAGADASVNVVDAAGNGITVSNVPVPVIVSASYHWSNGVLTATGTGFTIKAGEANDIDASKFTFRGEGGATYTLVGSPDIDLTSNTEFSITLDATDKAAVNLLLNKSGTQANDNTVYNLVAAENWAVGADAAVNVVDATTPITVGNFNNPPTGGNDIVNINEDSPHTFATNDFTYNDTDADPFAGIRIETIETAGNLEYNGIDIIVGTECPDVSLLVFKSSLNENAFPYATFTFKVKDNMGAYSLAAYTMTINVLPVNDAPVVANIELPAINYQEGDSPVALTNTISITDVDDVNIEEAIVGISLNYQQGQDELIFTNANGISGNWDADSGILTLSGTSSLSNYETALRSISYQNLSSAPSTLTRTVSLTVNDGNDNSDSVIRNISVTAINDAPIVTVNAEQTIIEEETFTFTNLSLYSEDFDSPSSILKYQLVEGPKHGKILDNNGMEITTFTQSDIANGSIKYIHNGDESREDYFTFTVTDGEAVSTGHRFTFTIINKNDTPIISNIPDIIINEDEAYTLDYKSVCVFVTDPDNADSTLFYTITRMCENIEIKSVNNAGCNICGIENWYGTTILKLIVSDGELSAETEIILIVNSVNDNPQLNGLPSNITFVNGDNYTINLHGSAEDVETPDSLLMFSIISDRDSIQTNYVNQSGVLSISALGRFQGSGNVTIRVTDADDGSSEETIITTVTPQTTNIENLVEIPEEYMLFQNFPNPFNPETVISYALPEESNIRIVIYNILGQQITVLIEGTKAAGYYNESWNASNLPSGIYFIKINAISSSGKNNYQQIKKMLLLK